jgi:hypothetical protein
MLWTFLCIPSHDHICNGHACNRNVVIRSINMSGGEDPNITVEVYPGAEPRPEPAPQPEPPSYPDGVTGED